MHPILDPICILKGLIGQEVTIVTPDATFRGVLAIITVKLIVLCVAKGVVYIDPKDVTAVSTAPDPKAIIAPIVKDCST
jgi:hypothetical protein